MAQESSGCRRAPRCSLLCEQGVCYLPQVWRGRFLCVVDWPTTGLHRSGRLMHHVAPAQCLGRATGGGLRAATDAIVLDP